MDSHLKDCDCLHKRWAGSKKWLLIERHSSLLQHMSTFAWTALKNEVHFILGSRNWARAGHWPWFYTSTTSKPGLIPAAVSFPSISIFRFLSRCPLAIFSHRLAIFHDWLLSWCSSLVLVLSLSSSLPSCLTFSLGDSRLAIQFILLCTCGVLANWIKSGTLF